MLRTGTGEYDFRAKAGEPIEVVPMVVQGVVGMSTTLDGEQLDGTSFEAASEPGRERTLTVVVSFRGERGVCQLQLAGTGERFRFTIRKPLDRDYDQRTFTFTTEAA